MLAFKPVDRIGRKISASRRRRGAVAEFGQPSPCSSGCSNRHPGDDNIIWFHDYLLYFIAAITAFVLALLVIVMVRFNARANPVPSRTYAQHADRGAVTFIRS